MEIRKLSIKHPLIKTKLGTDSRDADEPREKGEIILLDVVINANGDSLDLPTTVPGETKPNNADIHRPDEQHNYFVSLRGKDYALGCLLKNDLPIYKQPYFLGLLTGLGIYLGPDFALNNNCERFFEDIEITEETFFDSNVPDNIIRKAEDTIPETTKEQENVEDKEKQ